MNAYFELFGKRLVSETPISDFGDKLCFGEEKRDKYTHYFVAPNTNANNVRIFVSNIVWAKISGKGINCILKSNRTKEDEDLFLDNLKSIEYDEGYGLQELYGTIVFNDNTWMDRYEYDGLECWDHHSLPEEPNWDE